MGPMWEMHDAFRCIFAFCSACRISPLVCLHVCVCVSSMCFGSDASLCVDGFFLVFFKLACHGHHGNGIVEIIIANHFGNATLLI